MGIGKGLCKVHTYQKGPDQSRGIGDSHSIKIFFNYAGFLQSAPAQAGNGLSMSPAGNFRNNSAIQCMNFDLGCHEIGPDFPHSGRLVHFQNGSGGLVAGGFKS